MRHRRKLGSRSGLTLVEIAIGMVVMTIGVLSFVHALISSSRTEMKNRELARAMQAARLVLESIEAESFSQAFRRYNGAGVDDPGGANTAPGANFPVEGLSALPDDPDGMPGEVIFPIFPGNPTQLREDQVIPELGMPRDLNGNGIDAFNHATDYWILPVIVRVRWRSASGPGVYELKTVIGDY